MLLACKFRCTAILAAVAAAALIAIPSPSPALASAGTAQAPLVTRDVAFTGSGGLAMHGTVTAPAAGGTHPGLLLIGGSDWHDAAQLAPEAQAFARLGLVTFSYDKRSSGLHRDYQTYAADARAAFLALLRQPGVDSRLSGVWGVSEGGWIAPRMAVSTPEVAFVVTAGAVGTDPASQTAWTYGNVLRHLGVSGSLLRSFPVTFTRLSVGAGLFPEASYDPAPVLRRVRQPVLMIWSATDFNHPPEQSALIMHQALIDGGNTHYTIRFLPDASPSLRQTADGGWDHQDVLAPGYPEMVASWVRGLADGPPAASMQTPPVQATQARPLASLAAYESVPVQVAVVAVLLISFGGYLACGLAWRLRRRKPAGYRPALLAAWAGLVATLGVPGYFLASEFSAGGLIGPVVGGRPAAWLTLQLLAVLTVAAAVATALHWRRSNPRRGERSRLALLLIGAVGFIPWALYWGLLVP
jgi:uncharacterized protein